MAALVLLAMADIDGNTVTLGGKGSSLSPASIHAISTGLAAVRIDSSAQATIDKKIAATNGGSPRSSYTFASLSDFSLEECRAASTVLLHKFLNSDLSSACKLIPAIAHGLSSNESPEMYRLYQVSVTNEELCLLKRSHFCLYGVSALLDYELTALSTVVDAVAALSCEAIKADVSAFNLTDSGDGFTWKEEIRVANDMKVLLNGSKLVGGQVYCEVSSIPKIHAPLREVVKSVHAATRINVNSSVKVGPGCSDDGGASDAAVIPLLGMAAALLYYVGKSSFNRIKRNLDSITCDSLRNTLVPMFESKCFQDLGSKLPIMDAYISTNYNNFAHEL